MSTAGFVPEIAALSDQEGPVPTVRAAGVGALLSGATGRLRRSDGFSHARSLAFVTTLLSLQGMIALVATFAAFGNRGFGRAVEAVAVSAAPGPVGQALQQAVNQAERTAGLGRAAPLLLGVGGALFLGTTGMGQLQRAVNRLYGIERDRPTIRKYTRAFVLALTSGTALALSFLAVAFGRALGDNFVTPLWGTARGPIILGLLACAIALLLRWCPDRRQPPWPWLAPGAVVAVALWLAVTVGLAAFFSLTGTFGAAYGPLAGLLGLGIWSLLAAIALLYGAAVNAELEWRRVESAGDLRGGNEGHPEAGEAEDEAGQDVGGVVEAEVQP